MQSARRAATARTRCPCRWAMMIRRCRKRLCMGEEERAATLKDCPSSLSSPSQLAPNHYFMRPATGAQNPDCSLGAARQGSSSSSPPAPLPLSQTASLASISLQLLPPLSRALSTSPSDDPAILSDTHNKSNPAATVPPSFRAYSSSYASSARTVRRRTRPSAVEVKTCTGWRRKMRGGGRSESCPCYSVAARLGGAAARAGDPGLGEAIRREESARRGRSGVCAGERGELQGDGTAGGGGVFGCVGVRESLSMSNGYTYCLQCRRPLGV